VIHEGIEYITAFLAKDRIHRSVVCSCMSRCSLPQLATEYPAHQEKLRCPLAYLKVRYASRAWRRREAREFIAEPVVIWPGEKAESAGAEPVFAALACTWRILRNRADTYIPCLIFAGCTSPIVCGRCWFSRLSSALGSSHKSCKIIVNARLFSGNS